jgi:DNA-binding ferritin-like protein (Dps family)
MNELKMLNKLNNELDKQLNKEDSDIMTDIVCYIRAAGLSDKNQELIRQDLLEMALSAQERNEAFSMTVGKNYKEFCDDIISSMPKMTRMERLLNLFSTLLLCGSILLMISTLLSSEAYRILKEIFKGGPYNLNVSYSLSTVVLDIIITIFSIGIVQYIC